MTIAVIGVSACLLLYQGTIENTVNTTTTSFASLQENLSNNTTSTNQKEHEHTWKALDTDEEIDETIYEEYEIICSWYPIDYTDYHYCTTCLETEKHSFETMTLEEVQKRIEQEGRANDNLIQRIKCETCNYYFIEWKLVE
jgi:thiol:disulfide interchange protein